MHSLSQRWVTNSLAVPCCAVCCAASLSTHTLTNTQTTKQTHRKHRVALGLLFGRWGLPFGVPNHVPIMFVVGKVVPVKKTAPTDPGFAAAVDDAHSRVMVEMQALYDKYKGLYGWQDRPLVIV